MTAISDFLENELLDHVLLNNAYTAPATVYLALFTADPTDTGSLVNEVTAAIGYTRQPITFSAPSAGQSSNTGDLTVGPATANWGTVTHVAIMDGSTIGADNVLFHGALSSSRTVNNGDTFLIPTSNLTVTLS